MCNELRSRGFAGSVGTVRGYVWLVGRHGPHTAQRKLSDQQRFVQRLHRIEPSIAVGGSLTRNILG